MDLVPRPFLVFVFGAIVGSFLNVCIVRLPNGESLVSPGVIARAMEGMQVVFHLAADHGRARLRSSTV